MADRYTPEQPRPVGLGVLTRREYNRRRRALQWEAIQQADQGLAAMIKEARACFGWVGVQLHPPPRGTRVSLAEINNPPDHGPALPFLPIKRR